MKIIVEYDWVNEFKNWDEAKKHFTNFYDFKSKFIDKHEVIFYEFEFPYVPMEGQRVGTPWGNCIVRWSFLNLDNISHDFYFDNSRIVVSFE